MTQTIRAPRLPAGTEVGSTLQINGEPHVVLSISYEDRCVVLTVEPLGSSSQPRQTPPEPAQ